MAHNSGQGSREQYQENDERKAHREDRKEQAQRQREEEEHQNAAIEASRQREVAKETKAINGMIDGIQGLLSIKPTEYAKENAAHILIKANKEDAALRKQD
jgi:1-deoxy-D-xylulose 5-phosphate reductoisomerase